MITLNTFMSQECVHFEFKKSFYIPKRMLALRQARDIAENIFINEQIEKKLKSCFQHFNVLKVKIEKIDDRDHSKAPYAITIYVDARNVDEAFRTEVDLDILRKPLEVYICPSTY